MSFDYNVYFRSDCFVPLLSAICSSILCLFALVLFSSFIRDIYYYKNVIKRVSQCIFLVILIITMLNVTRTEIKRLSIGGIYLLAEKKEDTESISGIIEKMDETDIFIRRKYYNVENNAGKGEFIFVNGNRYYLMTYGDLKIGDCVVMQVLPKSRFVLEINKIPNGTESGG